MLENIKNINCSFLNFIFLPTLVPLLLVCANEKEIILLPGNLFSKILNSFSGIGYIHKYGFVDILCGILQSNKLFLNKGNIDLLTFN